MKRLLLYTIFPAMLAAIIGFYVGQSYIPHRIVAGMSGGGPAVVHRPAARLGTPADLTGHADASPTSLLWAPSGTLMLTSVPAGASISVNQKRQAEATPAQLHLPPGSYKVIVEKDGLIYTLSLELHNGETAFRKVTLQQ